MPVRNIELLQRTMQFIKDNPERHDQDYWGIREDDTECGTTACFAGWAILLSGKAKLNEHDEFVAKNNRSLVSPRRYAAGLLGLTDQESKTMFLDASSAEELELMVKDLVNGEQLKPSVEYQREDPEVF